MPKILEFAKDEIESAGDSNSPDILFFCLGCQIGHGVWLSRRNQNGSIWTYNNDKDKPTIHPSVLVRLDENKICHSFVKEGKIQFLSDCTHSLVNQTIELPEI